LLRGRSELIEYFGSEPQPGSLNILLDWPIYLQQWSYKVRLEENVVAWPATLEGRRCLVMRWTNCPLHVAEIISPYRFEIKKASAWLFSSNEKTLPLSLGGGLSAGGACGLSGAAKRTPMMLIYPGQNA
jgi:hypothetical protein